MTYTAARPLRVSAYAISVHIVAYILLALLGIFVRQRCLFAVAISKKDEAKRRSGNITSPAAAAAGRDRMFTRD